jgi:hypothetical protein
MSLTPLLLFYCCWLLLPLPLFELQAQAALTALLTASLPFAYFPASALLLLLPLLRAAVLL